MDEIISRVLQGTASDVEREKLHRWRSESAANEEHFQRFAEVWRVTGEYEAETFHEEPTVSASRVIRAAEASRFRSFLSRTGALGRAAAVLVALTGGYLVAQWGTQEPAPEPVVGVEVVTGAGETTTTRLKDGTVIRLAPESRLVVSPGGAPREVVLEGSAFFAVSKDSIRPFRILTLAGETRVLGTRFEMSARSQDLRVIVVDGRVQVESGGRSVEVGPSEVSHVRKGGEPSLVRVEDVWALMDWMEGFLVFESTPLREVDRELRRRFGTSLRFHDPALATETVTVWFGDEPLEEVVGILCRLVGAQCSVRNSTVHMERGAGAAPSLPNPEAEALEPEAP